MVSIGKLLYVFGGGIRSSGIRCVAKTNELHSFDTETRIWHRLTPRGPTPEISSFACVIPIGSFIFIGLGSGLTHNRVSSSCYLLDTVNEEITKMESLPNAPQARDGAAWALVGDNTVVLHGGQFLNDVRQLKLNFITRTREILNWRI